MKAINLFSIYKKTYFTRAFDWDQLTILMKSPERASKEKSLIDPFKKEVARPDYLKNYNWPKWSNFTCLGLVFHFDCQLHYGRFHQCLHPNYGANGFIRLPEIIPELSVVSNGLVMVCLWSTFKAKLNTWP